IFNDTATTEIYTLSLHDALPISRSARWLTPHRAVSRRAGTPGPDRGTGAPDRKSTRLNSVTRPSRMPSSAWKKNYDRFVVFLSIKVPYLFTFTSFLFT